MSTLTQQKTTPLVSFLLEGFILSYNYSIKADKNQDLKSWVASIKHPHSHKDRKFPEVWEMAMQEFVSSLNVP